MRPRGPPLDSVRPRCRGQCRGGAWSRRAARGRPPAAAPSSACRAPGPARVAAGTAPRGQRRAPLRAGRRLPGRVARGSSLYRLRLDTRAARGRRAGAWPPGPRPWRPSGASRARCARRARWCRPDQTASRRSSVSGVATRVSSRTFAYESSPWASACDSSGSVPSARATRTCSRAAPGENPTRQESQAAHERKPLFQPPRASNSRMRSSRRAVAASRCADSSAISSPSRSTSRSDETLRMTSPPFLLGATLYPGFGGLSVPLSAAIAAGIEFLATPRPVVRGEQMWVSGAEFQHAADTRRVRIQKSVKSEN